MYLDLANKKQKYGDQYPFKPKINSQRKSVASLRSDSKTSLYERGMKEKSESLMRRE